MDPPFWQHRHKKSFYANISQTKHTGKKRNTLKTLSHHSIDSLIAIDKVSTYFYFEIENARFLFSSQLFVCQNRRQKRLNYSRSIQSECTQLIKVSGLESRGINCQLSYLFDDRISNHSKILIFEDTISLPS